VGSNLIRSAAGADKISAAALCLTLCILVGKLFCLQRAQVGLKCGESCLMGR
jgi:hypothetical protein